MVLRYVFRHIPRARLRSLLSVLLAAALIASLGQFVLLVQDTRGRVEEMYAALEVDAVVVSENGTQSGGISYGTLHSLLEADFSESFYATARSTFYWVDPDENAVPTPGGGSVYDNSYFMVATNDPERFTVVETEYLDGYGAADFAESGEYLCIVNRELLAERGFSLGDKVYLSSLHPMQRESLSASKKKGSAFRIVGACECEALDTNDIIVPMWMPELAQGDFYDDGGSVGVGYCEFRMKNELLRDSDAYLRVPAEVLEGTGFKLRYEDDELRNTVHPLESNAGTLELILPVISAAVLLIGAAIPALVVIQSAKEAAIMRVLGTSKAKVCAILTLEQAALCAAGLTLGLTALALFHCADGSLADAMPFIAAFAAAYFALASAASLAGGLLVSAKKPLELLQTRE